MQPRVSVITPAYNRRDLMPATLDSVLGQTFPDFEYLIVDDGSTDGTFEWLKAISDPRVTVLNHENRANHGQAASINLGLSRARGDYLVILDSDDLLAPEALEMHLACLDRHDSLGMVYGQGYAIDVHGNRLYPLFSDDHQEEGVPDNLLLDCYVVSPGLCMFRRSIVGAAGPLEVSFRAAQDHDFLLRVVEKAPFAYSGALCFYYRKHDGSISTNGQLARWQNGFEILRRAASRYPYRNATLRKRKAVLCFRLGATLFGQGHRLRALGYLAKSGLLDPARAVAVVFGREAIR
ncbi:glycosyltransferase family 2 protein [Marinobacter flavimaris]|uniref:glycosyltransferase family 2 protein n=1 Tax=Marinobacter flavimaris TaxID=262076 RepID=UPI00386F0F36